jgi:hypothetical protein
MNVNENEAVVIVTYEGEQGELTNPVPFESAQGDVLAWVKESIESGSVRGMTAHQNVDLADFVVTPYVAKDGLPNRLVVRVKTPFGS